MEKSVGTNFIVLVIAALILLYNAVTRVLVEAHSFNGDGVIWMTIAIDVALLVAVFGLRSQLARALPWGDGRRNWLTPLFIIGLICGVVVLVLRISSREGWYTGHLQFNCCP